MDRVTRILQQYPHIWKSKAAFMAYLRGGIRRSLWNRAPQKLDFIKKHRKRIPNPNPRGRVKEVWGATCALTGETLPLKDIEVDHKSGNHVLKDIGDLQPFIENIVLVTEDDLQFVSKEAHKIKSMAERQGISFEEAKAEKEAIAIIKKKKDKEWLDFRGIPPAGNAKQRREQIVKEILRHG